MHLPVRTSPRFVGSRLFPFRSLASILPVDMSKRRQIKSIRDRATCPHRGGLMSQTVEPSPLAPPTPTINPDSPSTNPTMDVSSNTSPRSLQTPQSPAPLALSEFMAQTTPCSDTTSPSDKPPSPRDGSRLKPGEEPKQTAAPSEPQATIPTQQSEDTPPPPLAQHDSPPPTDWLATRQQLLPRRNQGRKADWIRGWSQAVSDHGEATYCACSETVEAGNRGRKGRTSDIAGNVRAILQRTTTPTHNKPATATTTPATPESEVCPNCSRPPSPPEPASPSIGSNLSSSRPLSRGGRSLAKRVGELFARVRHGRSSSAHKRDAEIRRLAWPEECQPRWATTGQGQKRFLVRPPSQPVSAPTAPVAAHKSQSMDYFATRSHSRGRISAGGVGGSGGALRPSSSELDEVTDSGAVPPGLARSMSRLRRAAALLQRAMNRSKG